MTPQQEAANTIRPLLPEPPVAAIVLGSGLGDFVDALTDTVPIQYNNIPHFTRTSIPGHKAQLIFGYADGVPVLAAAGRFHYYEGHPLDTVMLPVRTFGELGLENIIITNAAGCVHSDWDVGELMLVRGHMDYTFIDGPDDPPIIDSNRYHSRRLMKLAREAGHELGATLREGVYCWTLGPTFETPAEIVHIRALGGDAVGMSTVPDIRAAAEYDMEILVISCLTNHAAGISALPLNHEEVLAVGAQVSEQFSKLINHILGGLTS